MQRKNVDCDNEDSCQNSSTNDKPKTDKKTQKSEKVFQINTNWKMSSQLGQIPVKEIEALSLQNHHLGNSSPVEIFNHLFNHEIKTLIAIEANRYAGRKNKQLNITIEEL